MELLRTPGGYLRWAGSLSLARLARTSNASSVFVDRARMSMRDHCGLLFERNHPQTDDLWSMLCAQRLWDRYEERRETIDQALEYIVNEYHWETGSSLFGLSDDDRSSETDVASPRGASRLPCGEHCMRWASSCCGSWDA